MRKWKDIDRLRVPDIRYGEALFRRMYGEIRSALREHLSGAVSEGDIQARLKTFVIDDVVQSYFERFYVRVGVRWAKMYYRGLKSRAGAPEIKNAATDELGSVWSQQMLEYVRVYCGKKITSVISTQYDDIERITRTIFTEAAKEGWGATRIASEIVKKQGEIQKWEALRIARTEVISACNEGGMEGVSSTGIQTNKIWITTLDEKTRTSHMVLDNVPIPFNDKFDVDGDMLDYPGDPEAERAESVINCRCALAYEPVDSYIDQLIGAE